MANREAELRLVTLAVAFLGLTRDASAIERKGFIIGFGVGRGKMTCKDCASRTGPFASIHIGGMITEKLALVMDYSEVSRTTDSDAFSSVAGPALQYWVSPRVWVEGGVGGSHRSSGQSLYRGSKAGLAFLAGVGVDVVQKGRFAIDLQARFTTARVEGVRANNFMALVGLNLY